MLDVKGKTSHYQLFQIPISFSYPTQLSYTFPSTVLCKARKFPQQKQEIFTNQAH